MSKITLANNPSSAKSRKRGDNERARANANVIQFSVCFFFLLLLLLLLFFFLLLLAVVVKSLSVDFRRVGFN